MTTKMKFHRKPWNDDKAQYIITWWPHFGSSWCARQLGLSHQQVKSKVDKLKLRMLPKPERLCMECQERNQVSRRYGFLCRQCSLERREKVRRKDEDLPFEKWVPDILRTLRYRNNGACNLTLAYLILLWQKQNGQCFYSNAPLLIPHYGFGRRPFTASIDRIDSSIGYCKGNVVWAAWICNAGKSTLSIEEYVSLCRQVSEHYDKNNGDFLLELANEDYDETGILA